MSVILTIEGMSCGHCSKRVTEKLSELDGVLEVSVDLDQKSATLNTNQEIEESLLKETIENIGYNLTSIEKL